jgi:hypothetical protein
MGLAENMLDDREEAYLAWLCTAPALREPRSKEKYAVHAGVNVTTLRRWEKKDVFLKAWKANVDDLVGSPERTQTLLDKMYSLALEGDMQAAKLYVQVTGQMAPPTATVKVERTHAELSDAELDQLIADAAVRSRALRAV